MTTALIVDLFAGTQPHRWERLERACEVIETWPGSFGAGDIHKAMGGGPPNYGACTQAIRVLVAHGLIQRTGRHGSAVRYSVHPAHKAVAA